MFASLKSVSLSLTLTLLAFYTLAKLLIFAGFTDSLLIFQISRGAIVPLFFMTLIYLFASTWVEVEKSNNSPLTKIGLIILFLGLGILYGVITFFITPIS